MSTPIDSPNAQQLQVLLGHGGQRVQLAGDVEALARGHRAAELDDGVDLALAGAHRLDAQAHRAVGEVDDVAGLDRRGEPAQQTVMRAARPLLGPADDVRRSPGLSSATSSRSGPMRSLGPGRSWRMATWRPARSAAVRTRAAVSACSSASRGRNSGARRPSPPRPSGRAPLDRGRVRSWRRSSCGAWRPWRSDRSAHTRAVRDVRKATRRRRPGSDRRARPGIRRRPGHGSGCSPTPSPAALGADLLRGPAAPAAAPGRGVGDRATGPAPRCGPSRTAGSSPSARRRACWRGSPSESVAGR